MKRILVVDDEENIRTLYTEEFQDMGYEVTAVADGPQAVAAVETGPFDLVILDMIMPGMGGGKAFAALREIDSGVKVILSSGYSVDGEARQILEKGCNSFIQKPFRVADISKKIREVLENPSGKP